MNDFNSPVLREFQSEISIGGKPVGPGRPCFIIAEAGSNHDRDLGRALELVRVAADAGCDAVKFQSFAGPDIASAYRSPAVELPQEFRKWGDNLRDFYASFALPEAFYEPLLREAQSHRIQFFSSPFSEGAVDLLAGMGVPAIKISSFEIGHLPLIRHAATTGIPLILSTGMAGLGDIERALAAAQDAGAREVSLLHCSSNYPAGYAGANLRAMETLRQAFRVPVGYSDHTTGSTVPVAAVALGANILEKHFTLDTGNSPDHGFALKPEELRNMVTQMRNAESALGTGLKKRQPEEEEHARRGRRSIFSTRRIVKGESISRADLKVVRPGVGLAPMFLELICGRKAARTIEEDQPVSWDDVLSG